jgi:hypothetical protein
MAAISIPSPLFAASSTTHPTTISATAPADPKQAIKVLNDKNATDDDRLEALRQLQSMGPGARLSTPTVTKLLKRIDPLPSGEILGREAAIVLAHIGPDAVAAGMSAIHTELSTIPANTEAPQGWSDVLLSLGPATAPGLADAVNDKSEALARLAPHVLLQQISAAPTDKNIVVAIAKLPPKIAAAFQRASANMTTPLQHGPNDSPYLPSFKHDPSHDQWMSDLIDLAAACGPKALDQLVQSVDAKHAHTDPVDLNTTIDDYAKAFHEPGPVNDLKRQAAAKVRQAGNAAIVPLCNVIATDPAARQQAMNDLSPLLGGPRGKLTSVTEIRNRLINDLPPSAVPLDAKRKAALAKAVPALSAAADQSKPDPRVDFETPPIWILIMTAPDVPQAADALLSHLDHVSLESTGAAADSLAHCDKSIQAKFAKASPTTDSGKKILEWAHVRSLPLAEASAELKKMPIDQRSEFILAMDKCCGDDIVPLVLESLGQIKLNGFPPLHDRMPGVAPQVAAILDTADPAKREMALQLLENQPLPTQVLAKVASIEDEASLKHLSLILTDPQNRVAALPLLIERIHDPKPAIRAHAITVAAALGASELSSIPMGNNVLLGQNRSNNIPVNNKTVDQVAQAIAPHILDEDDGVRLAALSGAERMCSVIQPALAGPIKASTVEQRKKIAEQLASAKEDVTFAPGAFSESVLKPLESNGDSVVADHAQDLTVRIQGLLAERGVAKQSGEPAAPTARVDSSDPTERAKAAENASLLLNQPNGIPAFLKVVALENDPDPKVRAAARRNTRGFDCNDQLLARLTLMARSENEADRAAAAELFGRSLPDIPFPVSSHFFDPMTSPTAGHPPQFIDVLLTLNNDRSPKVKNAAIVALARCAANRKADAKATKVVLDALANASSLDPGVKASLVACIPSMNGGDLLLLANNPDADVKAAALLGIEQPPDQPINAAARVPIAVAAKATLSQGKCLRRMAIVSLLTVDPADPARQANGAKALLPATTSSDESIAWDADLALLRTYCDGRIPLVDQNDMIPPQGRLIRLRDGVDVGQPRKASFMELDYGHLIRDSLFEQKPARLAAIKTMGSKPESYLGSGWSSFSMNLRDNDPQIRAAAFAATAANLARACAENNGVPKQQPNWSFIYGEGPPEAQEASDREVREGLRRRWNFAQ